MYCSDLNMAGAGTTQSTKLLLPHEMLASASTQGHSAATLLLNPSGTSFFATSNHNHNSTTSSLHHSAANHHQSFQNSFSSFAVSAASVVSASSSSSASATSSHIVSDFRSTNHATSVVSPISSSAAAAAAAATSHNSTSSSSSTTEVPVVKPEDGNCKVDDPHRSGATTDVVDGSRTTTEDAAAKREEDECEPEIDIVISNVVCSFSVRCHLNLRQIALNGFNVEFRRENGMVTMKLRRPYTTASIWSSGRITCTGATSEDQAKVAARKYARCLQNLGFRVRFHNFRIVNVLGTCCMPWSIKITQFSEKYRDEASYEPELHPGVTYKLKEPKATLKIFSTGSITVTAASVAFVQQAIEHIYPRVYEFRKKRTPEEEEKMRKDKPEKWARLMDGCKEPSSAANESDVEEFNVDDLIEVDEDFVECDDENEEKISSSSLPVAGQSSSSALSHNKFAAAPKHLQKRFLSSRSSGDSGGPSFKRKRRRPAGKAANDPFEDIMQVSDDDGSDDDL